jgi:hypothetical protein
MKPNEEEGKEYLLRNCCKWYVFDIRSVAKFRQHHMLFCERKEVSFEAAAPKAEKRIESNLIRESVIKRM